MLYFHFNAADKQVSYHFSRHETQTRKFYVQNKISLTRRVLGRSQDAKISAKPL